MSNGSFERTSMGYYLSAVGAAFVVVLVLAACSDDPSGSPDGGTRESAHLQACKGFLLKADGSVVLSGVDDSSGGHGSSDGGMSHGDGGMSHGDGGMSHGDGGMAMADASPQPEALCIEASPLDATQTSATAKTTDHSYEVVVTSLRGALNYGTTEHEGFSIVVKDSSGSSVESGLTVELSARMPHHNKMMPQGHGPANDLDVDGFAAEWRADESAYVVDPVEFQMGSYWFLTIQIDDAQGAHSAHFTFVIPGSQKSAR